MRLDVLDNGRCVFDADGPYLAPNDSVVLARFALVDGEVVDRHPDLDDDQLRSWLQRAEAAPVTPTDPLVAIQETLDALLLAQLSA